MSSFFFFFLLFRLIWKAKRYKVRVGAIASGQFQIYQPFFPTHKERLGKKVTELWKLVNKADALPSGKSYLELVCIAEDMDDDEVEVDLPVLRVFYNKDKALNHA